MRTREKTKIMWIPGHCGIKGNELADETATYANKAPVYEFEVFSKLDVLNHIRRLLSQQQLDSWNSYNHHYKNVNIDRSHPFYPPDIPKYKIKIYVRLRLGHTELTHQHLLKRSNTPICPTCSTNIDIRHILEDCTAFNSLRNNLFKDVSIYDILKYPTESNINIIYEFISKCKITI